MYFITFSTRKICAYLWNTKRYLSYALPIKGCYQTVIAFCPPCCGINSDLIKHDIGLTVSVKTLPLSGIEVKGIDHLQQCLLQLFHSFFLLADWVLFSRDPSMNEYGSFARFTHVLLPQVSMFVCVVSV